MIRPIAFLIFAAAFMLAVTGWGLVAFCATIVAVGVGTAMAIDYLGLEL